jgi:hypothetical protein
MQRNAIIMILAMIISLSACATAEAKSGWQCAPYAREITPVTLRGNAWTWWQQADGKYERGNEPKIGAVIVFQRTGKMPYGHVGVVRRVVNSREVLLEQANWAPSGTSGRGKISVGDRVIDASPNNDWSVVRVYDKQSKTFGRNNPIYGFIYAPDYDPRTGIEWHAAEDVPGDAG